AVVPARAGVFRWRTANPKKVLPRGWPKTSRAAGGHLRRVIPALAQTGVVIVAPGSNDKTRRYQVESVAPQPPEDSRRRGRLGLGRPRSALRRKTPARTGMTRRSTATPPVQDRQRYA